MSRHLLFTITAIVLFAAAACGSGAKPVSVPTPSATSSTPPALPSSPGAVAASSPPPAAPTTRPTGSPGPSRAASQASSPITKLLVFVVENHSLGEMQAQMPFTNALAHRYGYADHYLAITHPSLPNYLAIAGGDTFGVADDDPPSAHPLGGASVFGAAVRHGSTARLYAEAMQGPCQAEPAGNYAVKHNPWAYFIDEASPCKRDDVPLAAFDSDVTAGNLPAVGMVIPDLCHDAHDCPLSQADAWLRAYVGHAMTGPDWTNGHLAIVITADEDDDAHGNQILTVVAHPALHHVVDSAPLSHYSLARAYADVAGIAPLRHAAAARDLLRSFGLTT